MSSIKYSESLLLEIEGSRAISSYFINKNIISLRESKSLSIKTFIPYGCMDERY